MNSSASILTALSDGPPLTDLPKQTALATNIDSFPEPMIHVDRMPFHPLPKLPARFTERAFRGYENVINEVVKNWPSATKFNTTLSLETFSHRLRDAIRSYRDNNWDSYIDRLMFMNIVDRISVRTTNQGDVIVCDRATKLALTAVKVDVVQFAPGGQNTVVRNPNEELVNSYAVLLASRQVESVDFVDVRPEISLLIETLPLNWDVVCERRSETHWKVV